MFTLAVLALAIASSTTALVIPRRTAPATYAVGYLEDYGTYHTRYVALGCQDHNNAKDDQFFDDCCHPMLATENLKDNRKPYCTPSEKASSAAAAAEPTSTIVPPGDDDCSDDDDETPAADPTPTSDNAPKNVALDPSSSPSYSPSPAPSPTPTETTTTSTPPPKPSPTPTETTTTSSPPPKPSPTPDTSSGGSGSGLSGVVGDVHTGTGTFFYQNGKAGNCGQVHTDDDLIVALQTETYADGAHCGKTIVIENKAGETVEAQVADSCPTCGNKDDVDMSVGVFSRLASLNDGVFNMKWGFKA